MTTRPSWRISKCTCGFVARPLRPTLANLLAGGHAHSHLDAVGEVVRIDGDEPALVLDLHDEAIAGLAPAGDDHAGGSGVNGCPFGRHDVHAPMPAAAAATESRAHCAVHGPDEFRHRNVELGDSQDQARRGKREEVAQRAWSQRGAPQRRLRGRPLEGHLRWITLLVGNGQRSPRMQTRPRTRASGWPARSAGPLSRTGGQFRSASRSASPRAWFPRSGARRRAATRARWCTTSAAHRSGVPRRSPALALAHLSRSSLRTLKVGQAPVASHQLSATRSTRASRGPCSSRLTRASMASRPPSARTRTRPSRALSTYPDSPRSRAWRRVNSRNPTPCTRPSTVISAAFSCVSLNSSSGHGRSPIGSTRSAAAWRVVGARGFEPPTSRSRTVRATRLRYAPN